MRERILTGDRCFLSALRRDDLDLIRTWRNLQMAYLRQYKPLTERDQDEWWKALAADGSSILFAIISFKDDELVGYCGLTNIHLPYARAEVSFLTKYIDNEVPDYRETFLDVLRMLCTYAFKNMNLNRLYTETYEFRQHHIKILEEFGFVKEGVLREHVFKKDGFSNSVMHSILRHEFA